MKIFDAHLHTETENICPEELLRRFDSIGIYGATIMSPPPESPVTSIGVSYDTRMRCLAQWTEGRRDRLFPVFYIHPLEKDAVAKAKDAAQWGVDAFKIIYDCLYPYEEASMKLLSAFAELGKPVMVHSGILWNGVDSSKYNRPLGFEKLVEIPGLRFSMGHCSWPWTDECIALYGKFLNAYVTNPNASAEMFFDLTPGTPVIYRKDLIMKLFGSGYDTPHNIMYGTDCTANNYNTRWAESWIRRDRALMEEAGAGEAVIEHYFGLNYLRFIGRLPKNFTHVIPVSDAADAWTIEYANRMMQEE